MSHARAEPRTVLRNKCIVLGNQATGKTALTQVFHSDGTSFPKNYTMTLHADISVKVVNIPDTNVAVELFIYDIAGHDVLTEYVPKYCEGASTFILVYDVTNADSFAAVQKWLQIAKRSRLGKGIHGVLVANKIDLSSRRVISPQQGEEFAKANKLGYFECSAATNQDVDAPFYYLSNWFYEHYEASIKMFTKISESN
ncbi:Intraflagellar transport protein 27 [Chytridiales sp. JEL 0842]|nr:Intraflagellar transport protein 27 [Chytridiales sp. JEL 0842]